MDVEGKRLSIVMVVASPFPANHGTPAGIKELVEAVGARGHQIHIVTYHFGEGPPPARAQIHRIADLRFRRKVRVGPSYEKPVQDLLLLIKLVRVVIQKRVDLIHAHNYEGALIGYVASRLTRKPLIYHAVNSMIDELPGYNFFKPRILAVWIARFLDYWVPRTAGRIISISEDLTRFLLAQGIRPQRIHTVPLGVDCSGFDGHEPSAIRERYGIGDDPLVIYTGILDSFQRIDYLLRAMRVVLDEVAEARLLIAANLANESDLEACRRMLDELSLTRRVDILTEQPFAEIPPLLAAADVAVVCRPRCPGVPVKLLNYMAAGKPIVVFAGSAKGLQHMQHAIVVPDHDWRAMGRGIVTLLRDRSLAQKLGQNARSWVTEHLGWPPLVKRIEAVYYELLRA